MCGGRRGRGARGSRAASEEEGGPREGTLHPPSRTTRCPALAGRGPAGARRNQRRLQAGLLAFASGTKALVIVLIIREGLVALPGTSGGVGIFFSTLGLQRTARGRRHPHQLNGALWGSFVSSKDVAGFGKGVCVCVCV